MREEEFCWDSFLKAFNVDESTAFEKYQESSQSLLKLQLDKVHQCIVDRGKALQKCYKFIDEYGVGYHYRMPLLTVSDAHGTGKTLFTSLIVNHVDPCLDSNVIDPTKLNPAAKYLPIFLSFGDVSPAKGEVGDERSLIGRRILYWVSGSYGLPYDEFCATLPQKDFPDRSLWDMLRHFKKYAKAKNQPIVFLVDELMELGGLTTSVLLVLSAWLSEGDCALFVSSLIDEPFREMYTQNQRYSHRIDLLPISSVDEIIAGLVLEGDGNALSRFLALKDGQGSLAVKMILWGLSGSPRLLNEFLLEANQLSDPIADNALAGYEMLKEIVLEKAASILPASFSLKALIAVFIQLRAFNCHDCL